MKKNESRSHLRPGNKVSYFTYDDLYVIPDVIDKIKGNIDSEYIVKLKLIQTKVLSNFRKYEKVREQTRINKQKRMKKLREQQKLKEVNVNECRGKENM